VDPEFSVELADISWKRSGGYPRSNWVYEYWPGGCDSWSAKVKCFMDVADTLIDHYDVVSFQFSYLEVDEASSIANPANGFFADNPSLYDVHDLEAYETAHPGKTIIYWTSSLARGIGSAVSDTFNHRMRQYAKDKGKPLFDVADILSHDPDGFPCYDNRDGKPYTGTGGNTENYPDDGIDRLAICQHYTSETDGGHLGNPSVGMIRVAKGFWVLMAQLAGWQPQSVGSERASGLSAVQSGARPVSGAWYSLTGRAVNPASAQGRGVLVTQANGASPVVRIAPRGR
jgi:hypothetical protein